MSAAAVSAQRRLTLVIVLALAGFSFQQTSMIALLPALVRDFHASAAWSTWLVTGFLMVGAVATPLIGKLADQYGRGPLLRGTVALFALASLGAACAPSIGVLIALRALCGISGAFLALGVALAAERLPAPRRAGAVAAFAASMAGGNVIAVLLAPALADAVSWRAVFAFAAALPLAALVLSRGVPLPAVRRDAARIDIPGAALLAVTIGSLMLALTEGNAWGWTSVPILALLAGALGAGAAWIGVELRTAHPAVDLRLLAQRTVALTNVAIVLAGAGVFASLVLVGRLVAAPRGAPAALAGRIGYGFGAGSAGVGLFLLPTMIVGVLAGAALGAVSRRHGWRLPFVVALVTLCASLALLAGRHGDESLVVVAMALLGFSMSLSSIGGKLVADDVSPSEHGVVVGLNMVAYYLGGVIGTQGVTAILDGRLVAGTTLPTNGAFTTSFYVLAGVVLVAVPIAVFVHPRGRARVREPGDTFALVASPAAVAGAAPARGARASIGGRRVGR